MKFYTAHGLTYPTEPIVIERRPNDKLSPLEQLLKDHNVQPGQALVCVTDAEGVEHYHIEETDPNIDVWWDEPLIPISAREPITRIAKIIQTKELK